MINKLGIIGGGQLALMLIQSASKYGIECVCLDPSPQAPAFKYASKIINASFGDKRALQELEKLSDVIVYEFENVNLEILKTINQEKLYQGIDVLYYAQNRIREKQLAKKSGIQTAQFMEVNNSDDLANACKTIGFPAILKTCELGYDGKGQLTIDSPADLNQAIEMLKVQCIYEQKVKFDYELSIIAIRNHQGEIVCFDPVINEHVNGILHKTTYDPTAISNIVNEVAQKQITKLMEANDFYGILCIEFFVKENRLYFNEMAPRPHNSGHITMDATNVSQFDNVVRAALKLPLVSPKLCQPMVMYNVLGQHLLNAQVFVQKNSFANGYFYGKDIAKTNRKMGHINLALNQTNIKKIENEVFKNE